ncbi:transposable element Tcb1 transposase [Trichonephila clavipes]|uniref:Transposable element Tcb1 transposase n=1 Tax=Trichonephila clavipes TaxID=2585209 RepID=A0A8X6V9Q0_TRICX|nr:transposable element Tcb1 transposase [Trichonephila clavipes]
MPGKRARRHFSQLSEFERGLIIRMKTEGWSTRRVAGQVDRSECAVRNCWEQRTREGTHARKTGSGAAMKITRREDQRNVRGAKPDQCGMSHIGKRLCLVMNPGLFWGQITVCGCGGALVRGTIPPQNVLRHTARTAGVIVWGAIAYDSRSTLIVMRGTLTGQRYVDDILRPHVGPFLNGLPGAIFQQDNARPHTARVAQDFLRHFQTLPWPARSPDLSPVEHVWDQLKRQMPSCHSVHDLELAVQDLWAHLPQDSIRCLINSLPDCVVACIAAGGGQTRY